MPVHRVTTPYLLLLAAPAVATGGELRELGAECETALALSAVPVHLRESAGVYLLGDEGYELARPAHNGFTCIVERNHGDAIIPQCFDAASTNANLVAILDTGAMIRAGKSFEEIAMLRKKKLEAGEYETAGHGIAYMISEFNYIYNEQNGAMLDVAPHLMFHAPGLTAEDAGADFDAAMNNRGLPIMNAIGPHGFMISFVEKPSDSSDVRSACAGQLPDTSALVPFPPAS